MTYSSEVMTGISATTATKAASRTARGIRSSARRARPGPAVRSSDRATHSSTPICGPAGGVGARSLTSDLLHHGRPEQPGRAEEHEDDQDREHDQILERRGEVADRERLDHADDHPAEHRAGDVADPADDGGREGLQAGAEAHVRLHALED